MLYFSRIAAIVVSKVTAKDTGAGATEAAGCWGDVAWEVFRGGCVLDPCFSLYSLFVWVTHFL